MKPILSLILIAFAGLGNLAQASDPNADYTQLCSYDSWCPILKDPAGNFIPPSTAALEALRIHRTEILDAAKTYGVDARAIAGALLADLSLTPYWATELRAYVISKKTGNPPPGLKKLNDIPLGIIKLETAIAAEELAAQTEGRPKRTGSEIDRVLSTSKGTIQYTAAILKDAVDQYKKHGLSIETQPEIQTTLYNLGGPEGRAKRSKESGNAPRHNFFGFFVKTNLPLIEAVLDPSKSASAIVKSDASVCALERKKWEAKLITAKAAVSSLSNDIEQKLKKLHAEFNAAYQQGPSGISDKKLEGIIAVFQKNGLCESGMKPRMTSEVEYKPAGQVKPGQPDKWVHLVISCGTKTLGTELYYDAKSKELLLGQCHYASMTSDTAKPELAGACMNTDKKVWNDFIQGGHYQKIRASLDDTQERFLSTFMPIECLIGSDSADHQKVQGVQPKALAPGAVPQAPAANSSGPQPKAN